MNDEMAAPPQVPPHDAGAQGANPPALVPGGSPEAAPTDGGGHPTPDGGGDIPPPFLASLATSTAAPRPVTSAPRPGPPRPGSSRPAPATAAAQQQAPVIPPPAALPDLQGASAAPAAAPAAPAAVPPADDEQFESIAAMPIISIDMEPDPDDRITAVIPINEPPAADAGAAAAAPGIQTGVDPGWTPAPAEVQAAATPAAASLLSTDVEELAEDDLTPASDRPPPPPRSMPGAPPASLPPRPPPAIGAPVAGTPPPPPATASSEIDVDMAADDEPPPISVQPVAAPPPPPAVAAAPVSVPSPPVAPPGPPPAPAAAAPAAPAAPAAAPASAPAAQARPVSKPAADGKKRARPWWEEMFDDDFLRSIKQPTAKQIATESAFIDDRLGLREGAYILDLACGNGRHAIDLTRRGYKVVGFDLSLAMMARAQDEAEAAQQKINFLHGDMREMTFENMFDGIYNWGMSFGYFEEEKNFSVLQRMHRALRSGGVLLLDLANRDYIAANQPNLVWFEGEGCICMDETNLDFITSRLKVKRTVMLEDGRTRELDFSIRLYALNELGKLLHDAGFKVIEVSGHVATPGVFFGSESPRCIILAERA